MFELITIFIIIVPTTIVSVIYGTTLVSLMWQIIAIVALLVWQKERYKNNL